MIHSSFLNPTVKLGNNSISILDRGKILMDFDDKLRQVLSFYTLLYLMILKFLLVRCPEYSTGSLQGLA